MPGTPFIRPPSPLQAGPSSSKGSRASGAQPRRFPRPPNLSDVARVHYIHVYREPEPILSPPAYVIPDDIGDSLTDSQLLEWSVQFAHAFRTGKYRQYTFDAAGKVILRPGYVQEAAESAEPNDAAGYATPIDDRIIEALSSSLETALETEASFNTAMENLSSSFSTAVLALSNRSAASQEAETSDVTADAHNNAFRALDIGEFFGTEAAVSNIRDTDDAEVIYRGRNNGMPSPVLPVARRRQYDHPQEQPPSPDENVCIRIPEQLPPRPAVDSTPTKTSTTVTPASSHPVSPLVTCTGAVGGESSTRSRPASPEDTEMEEASANLHEQAFRVNDLGEYFKTKAAVANLNDTDNAEVLFPGRSDGMPLPTLPVHRPRQDLHSPSAPLSPDENVCVRIPEQLPPRPADINASTPPVTAEAVATPPTTTTIVTPINSNPVSPLVTCTGTVDGDSTASTADTQPSLPANSVNDRSVSPSVTCTEPVDVDSTQAATDDDSIHTSSTQSSNVTNQLDEDVSADTTKTNSPSTSGLAKPESSTSSSETSVSSVNTSNSPSVTCSEAVLATPSAVINNSSNDSVSPTVTCTEAVVATPTTNTTTPSVKRKPVSPSVTCTGPVDTGSAPSSSATRPSSRHGDVARLNRNRFVEESADEPTTKRQARVNAFMEMKRKQAIANRERHPETAAARRSNDRQHVMRQSLLKTLQAFFASEKKAKLTRQHDDTTKDDEPSAKKMKAPHYHLRAYGMDELRRQEAAKRKAAMTLALRKQAAEQQRHTTPASPPFLVAPPNSPNPVPASPPTPIRKPIKRRPLVDYASPEKKQLRTRLVDYDVTPPPSPAPIPRRPLVDYPSPPTSPILREPLPAPSPVRKPIKRRPLVDYVSPEKKQLRTCLVDYDVTPLPSPAPIPRRPLVDYPSPIPSPIPRQPSPAPVIEAPKPLPAPSPVQNPNLPAPPMTPPAIHNVPAPEQVPQTPPTQQESAKDIGTPERHSEAPKPVTTSTEVQTEPVKTLVDCAVQTDAIIEVPIAIQTVPAATQTPILVNTDIQTQTEPVPTANAEVQVDPPVEPIVEQPVPDFEPLQDDDIVDIIEPVPEEDEPEPMPEENDDDEPIVEIHEPAPEEDEPEADEPMPDNVDDEEDEPSDDEPADVDIFEPAPMDDIDFDSEDDDDHSVDQPIPAAQPNQRRRRQEDPWRNLQRVPNFRDANLPAPTPMAMNVNVHRRHLNHPLLDPYLQEFTPLTPTRLLQEAGGDHFITGLYEGGIVTLQGQFDGVPTTSDLFARAQNHPAVLYHNPRDSIDQVVTGVNHIAMLSVSGRLYTVGRANEGQLGRPHHRHLNPTPDNMRRHVRLRDARGQVLVDAPEVRFERIAAAGNITVAWTALGEAYAAGTTHNEEWTSEFFVRVPDHDNDDVNDWA